MFSFSQSTAIRKKAALMIRRRCPFFSCNSLKSVVEFLPMSYEIDIVGDDEIRKEKEKARQLRRTQWWHNKLQAGVCYYCNHEVGRDQLTMDHVVPLSRGGKSKKGNIVAACKECNSKKKYLLPVEWEDYLESLKKMSGQM